MVRAWLFWRMSGEKAQRFLKGMSTSNGFPEYTAIPRFDPSLNIPTEWAKGSEGMAAAFATDLSRRADSLVKDFAIALATLVHKKQAGQVQWTCSDACNYWFFTYRVTSEQQTYVRSSVSRGIGRTVHRTEIDFERVHKHICHSCGLVAARRTSVNDSQVKIPTRVKELIRSMPDWVREAADLIVGTQVQECVIEQDVKVAIRTAVTERIVYDPVDPCLAIGGIVLTGWNMAEVDEELRQQVEEHRKESQRELIPRSIVAALVGGAAGALFAALLWCINWLIGKSLGQIMPDGFSYLDRPLLVFVSWSGMGFLGSLLAYLWLRLPSGHESEHKVLVPILALPVLGIASIFVITMPGSSYIAFGMIGAVIGLGIGALRCVRVDV